MDELIRRILDNEFIVGVVLMVLSLVVIVLVILVFYAVFTGRDVKIWEVKIGRNGNGTGVDDQSTFILFKSPETPSFLGYIKTAIKGASRVRIIGIGAKMLHNEGILRTLISRTAHGCKVEIYLADPYSRYVEQRLVEEERGDDVPLLRRSGLVETVRTITEQADITADPHRFTFKLFPNYLTFSLIIIDDQYLFYPYGYKRLGTTSPVLGFSGERADVADWRAFAEEQYESIREASVDAKAAYRLRDTEHVQTLESQTIGYTQELVAAAIYIVPPIGTNLYEFGTKVVGYDVRREKRAESKWTQHAGDATQFGFHITLADALYFLREEDIELAWKELEWVAQDIEAFSISLRVQGGFPDENTIALVCEDDSGYLELLHTELVCRFYSQAVASNYSLKRVRQERDTLDARNSAMVKRYHAPYILTSFRPHFTLLSNVQECDIHSFTTELHREFEVAVQMQQYEVGTIALMQKKQDGTGWQIRREIQLPN